MRGRHAFMAQPERDHTEGHAGLQCDRANVRRQGAAREEPVFRRKSCLVELIMVSYRAWMALQGT